MYSVQDTTSLRRNLGTGRLKERVGGTVLLLGTCSLLTDISSEMVSAILPLYLVATLGFSPLQYGIVDGLYQGASAIVRLTSGFLGDKLGRHKAVAAFGYGLSAICKLGLAVVGGALGATSGSRSACTGRWTPRAQ
jgi:MFS family permease